LRPGGGLRPCKGVMKMVWMLFMLMVAVKAAIENIQGVFALFDL
jgi:hypothetical protein